mmetsp:Transcript_6711/g.16302  ORF Transcript_6711/g.16302 Transcript_6711/m.16302 type:complete len:254 (+) Transcript_6711:125-886(+)
MHTHTRTTHTPGRTRMQRREPGEKERVAQLVESTERTHAGPCHALCPAIARHVRVSPPLSSPPSHQPTGCPWVGITQPATRDRQGEKHAPPPAAPAPLAAKGKVTHIGLADRSHRRPHDTSEHNTTQLSSSAKLGQHRNGWTTRHAVTTQSHFGLSVCECANRERPVGVDNGWLLACLAARPPSLLPACLPASLPASLVGRSGQVIVHAPVLLASLEVFPLDELLDALLYHRRGRVEPRLQVFGDFDDQLVVL